ncbi:MAG: PD40 domain-containing protein [Fimbriimonadaceae bacterium]|nr:PD40 domain-containing protein [Fimbriimonadaceae bacterium]
MRRWVGLAAAWAVLLTAGRGGAELPDGFNHPEVSWREIETEHFVIVYAASLEDTAQLAARILEEVHPATCAALRVTPREQTTVILADFDDIGFNNFARRMQHVIYISNPVMNQARVDREAWLHHLLSHEYVHVVNGWALRDAGRFVGPLVEWTGMELQPQWFTEGLAEFVASGGDKSQPNFVLQAAEQGQLLYGGKLDIADLRFDVIETAVVYRQGQSMCAYLAERYGDDIFARVLEQYGHTPEFDISFLAATGQTVEAFYWEWIRFVESKLAGRPAADPTLQRSSAVETPLEAVLGGAPSPDGQWVALYGVANWEEPIPGLFLRSADGRRFRKIAANLDMYDSWRITWSADSRRVLYAGRHKNGKGSVVTQAYLYDLERQQTQHVASGGVRLGEPALSPDGSRIAFVAYHHERPILATMKVDGSDVQYLGRDIAEHCFSPAWSPDGQRIVFSLAGPQGADLAVIGADGQGLLRLTQDAAPDQYPAWSPDGKWIAFVSYRQPDGRRTDAAVSAEASGLSVAATDLYLVSAAGGPPTRVTNCTSGGCYYPTWSADSRSLLFSLFQVRHATLRQLPLADLQMAAAPSSVAPAAADLQPATIQVAAVGTVAAATSVRPSALADSRPVYGPATGTAATAPRSAPTASRPYRGIQRMVPYITRPYKDQDGLGDVFGVRTRFADPLLQHQLTAQLDYGTGRSDQIGFEAGYTNHQTQFQVGANFFRRVPPLRGERNALVAETALGFELLAELPIVVGHNAYSQDKLQFGYEMAERQPFATIGGVLRPAPQGAKIGALSIGYDRSEVLPGIGEQTARVKITRADHGFGSQLDYFNTDLTWVGRFYAPSPRAKLSTGINLNWFDGEDFTKAESQRWLLSGEVRYDWRLCDQLRSRYTWPYLHVGPVEVSAAYQLRELINGTATGADLRDRFSLELRNRGYLSRHAAYEFRAGPTIYIGQRSQPDWIAQFKIDLRDLPY